MAKKMLIAAALTLCLGSAAHADGHWHGGGGWGGHWGGGGWGWHGGGNDLGSGIVGGIIGGAIGNLFAPAPVIVAPPVYVQPVQPVPEIIPGSPAWYQYCQNKYRSWDGSSYLGFDGQRHPCV